MLASMLACEMSAYYKGMGKTLVDRLNELYDKFGYHLDMLESFVLKGKQGSEKIKSVMSYLRENSKELFPDVEKVIDYSQGVNGLPKENVLKFFLEGGSWFAARPSGTEPKLKTYYCVRATDEKAAVEKLGSIREKLESIIGE